MVSSFDKVINRRNTDSLKWDGMKERFGPIPDDTLPMWVADMDFLSPEPVIKALRSAYEKGHKATAATHHNVFGLAAAKAAYSFGDPWRREMLACIERNLEQAITFFQISMPWVGLTRPEGTYLLWLDFRKSGLDSEKITERLLQKGRVALDPGHWFGKEGEGFQRLNVACPAELLEDGLRRIRSAFADIRPEVE